MKIAFVFPGQGSQSVGMLDALSGYKEVTKCMYTANEVLDNDLLAMVNAGPAEKLNQTQWTQPALLALSVGLFNAVQARTGVKIDMMAGHSLGEYSALVCAGVISFEEALLLVHKRGLYMQQAVPAGTGSMAAVLGLGAEEIESACLEAQDITQGLVSPANYNSPEQIVIAGDVGAVEKASDLCVKAGAKKVMSLAVSVPSHCELMKPAAQKLAKDLHQLSFNQPQIKVLHNVDVAPHKDQENIKTVLHQQLFHPVRWTQTMTKFRDYGIEHFAECGPGKVLSGLFKRFDRNLKVTPLNTPKGIEKLTEDLS